MAFKKLLEQNHPVAIEVRDNYLQSGHKDQKSFNIGLLKVVRSTSISSVSKEDSTNKTTQKPVSRISPTSSVPLQHSGGHAASPSTVAIPPIPPSTPVTAVKTKKCVHFKQTGKLPPP